MTLKLKEIKNTMNNTKTGFNFGDWGSWGIGDFYEGNDEELKTAIKNGKPFDTGWHGYKKECQSMRVFRDEDGVINVEVYEEMDDVMEQYDLFYVFLTDEEMEKLTDEMVEEIRDDLMIGDFVEETQESDYLPADVTFEDVMKKAYELADICDQTLKDSFAECIGTTLYVLYKDDPKRDQIIDERIKQYSN